MKVVRVVLGTAAVVGAFAIGGLAEQRDPSTDEVLRSILPYYQVEAPAWCAEDMACWIGSAADGRSPEEVLRNLRADLLSSSQAYAE